MSEKDKLLNCYQDLQRVAVSYYSNPRGRVHFLFLSHALEILRELKDTRSKGLIKKVKEINNDLKKGTKSKLKLVVEILTTGILLKP
ncbi:hypothetical protein A2686_01395 [Candidatus Woesebacteria bacterium RIFCSPHIGHO2_01_FULL_38_10]|uniref:Uncharacterized protein n=1 Tax=Candidatus Woesebacteria bacterium RIFCSPLOWO2_01_FULL_39_10b TaxID=1802517 RepID=A0A1F8B7F4_9BACT|nr:MAG: hypothetical protein A2686_01395 [Candidatus Woesebacteria bacterium RIFCSPHIGHO2_01_FULL_38_10]OGM59931.1 MAG: hypothetical protein A2892_05210 [Candidatus Woesebacteria bacterium RIFCSPLOWO2_01_FULL_39_10b]